MNTALESGEENRLVKAHFDCTTVAPWQATVETVGRWNGDQIALKIPVRYKYKAEGNYVTDKGAYQAGNWPGLPWTIPIED